jgi:hypothetical protein
MPHERIIASVIYCYERDPSIVDAGLYLRSKRDGNEDFPNEGDNNDNVSVHEHGYLLWPRVVHHITFTLSHSRFTFSIPMRRAVIDKS